MYDPSIWTITLCRPYGPSLLRVLVLTHDCRYRKGGRMTRNLSLMSVAAAAVLLGMGGGKVETLDEADAKLREERDAQHRWHVERANARQQARIDAQNRRHEDREKLRAGIDPTNGNPLSRQQRRQLRRSGFVFAGDA